MNVVALILAGVSGNRLWPLSRQAMPKQLLSLRDNRILLQETCRRIWSFTPLVIQWALTGDNHYFQVINQIESLKEEFHSEWNNQQYIEVLKEPFSKNTVMVIFWAAVLLLAWFDYFLYHLYVVQILIYCLILGIIIPLLGSYKLKVYN